MREFSRKIRAGFRFAFFESPYEPLELAGGIVLMFMSFAVINPRIDSFYTGTAYKYFLIVAPELFWGCLFFFIGLLQIFAFCSGDYRFRMSVNMISCIVWFGSLLLFLLASTGVILPYGFMLGFGVFSTLIVARLKSDYDLGIEPWTGKK